MFITGCVILVMSSWHDKDTDRLLCTPLQVKFNQNNMRLQNNRWKLPGWPPSGQDPIGDGRGVVNGSEASQW